MGNEVIDYKFINVFLPSIKNYFPENDKIWKTISCKLLNKCRVENEDINKNGVFLSQTTIFELMINAFNGNLLSKYFLDFINEKIQVIDTKINPNLKQKFKLILQELLQNFGTKESKYLDRVGEICALERFLLSQDYELIYLEYKFKNNKSYDFSFQNISDKKITHIELLNIHILKEKTDTEEKMYNFLFSKISEKILSKTKSLVGDGDKQFITIIWGDFSFLYSFKHIFKRFEKEFYMIPFYFIVLNQRKYYFVDFDYISIYIK